MKGLFSGKKTLYIHTNEVKEILDVITLKKEMGIKNVVLVEGYDSWMVADLLKENNISVILKRVHSLPRRAMEDVHLPFKIPQLLDSAGVLFCLNNAGSMERMASRNLPFYAGTACAYGLEYEKAITSITLNPAKILGIDHLVGSLEKGKLATLFISTGDPLDMRTNNVIFALINGNNINLDNRQKQLYRKYKDRLNKLN